jgi:hypothetical protein
MHIVEIHGGLGNQMFQYAFALALNDLYGDAYLDLARITRESTVHNGYELGRLFRISLPICSDGDRRRLADQSDSLFARGRRKLGIYRLSSCVEKDSNYNPRLQKLARDTYFSGYWQSYKYFEKAEGLVREAFTFIQPMQNGNKRLLETARGRPLLGVHVRRGDYQKNPNLGGVCERDYFLKAASIASQDFEHPLFIFFSDDLDWCRANLAESLGECVYADWNRGADSFEDMRLMSFCDRLVMSNSSFSWWGAWLGRRDRCIVAPSRWFAEGYIDNRSIIPPEWTRVSVREDKAI